MKRIISIAMCFVMAAVATQVSAQKKNPENDKQKTEQKNDKQGPGKTDGQSQASPADMAKRWADRMKEQLSLSDAQYAKVLELNQAQMKDRQDLPSREEMDKLTDEQKAARRDEMKKLRDEYNAKLKNILTAEQYSKYEELSNNGPRGPRPEGSGRGDGR